MSGIMGGGKNRLQRKAGHALALRRVTGSSSIRKSSTGATKAAAESLATLHRGRRKRLDAKQRSEKKREFVEAELAKIDNLIQAKRASAKRERAVKLVGPALAVLSDDLVAALPDDTAKQAPEHEQVGDAKGRGTNKSEQNRSGSGLKHRQWAPKLIDEKQQMERVLKHDAFINTGLDALTSHLSNTVSCQAAEIPPPLPTNKPKSKDNEKIPSTSNHTRTKRKHNDGADEIGGKPKSRSTTATDARRQYKKDMAQLSLQKGAKKRSQVVHQSFKSLLGGNASGNTRPSASRGRIGEKREKDLH